MDAVEDVDEVEDGDATGALGLVAVTGAISSITGSVAPAAAAAVGGAKFMFIVSITGMFTDKRQANAASGLRANRRVRTSGSASSPSSSPPSAVLPVC